MYKTSANFSKVVVLFLMWKNPISINVLYPYIQMGLPHLFALIFTVLRASNAFQDFALKGDITGGSMSMKGRVNQMSGK